MATGFPTAAVTIPTKGLPDAKVGAAYSYFLDALDYDPGGITWSLSGGALPGSFSLNTSTGEVSSAAVLAGEVGTYSPEFTASDGVKSDGVQVLPLRVVPELGNARRYQMEESVEGATQITPVEGSVPFTVRRILERLLARTYGVGAQIEPPYFLDARDLQVVSFDAVPLSSLDDVLRSLLAQIIAFGTGLEDGAAGMTTVNGNDKFEIHGVGTINVVKGAGNYLEISYTGAALSAPFDMLPAPSGDASGVTDAAAINAFYAAVPQRWVVADSDVGGTTPYYINADITVPANFKHRLSGKSRGAFTVVGVGGVREWNGIELLEHAQLTDVRPVGDTVVNIDDVFANLTVGSPFVASGQLMRMRNSHIRLDAVGANVANAFDQFEAADCYFEFNNAGAITAFVVAAGAFRFRIDNCVFSNMVAASVGIDLSAIAAATALIQLGSNEFWGGDVGTPITGLAAATAILGGLLIEDGSVLVPSAAGVPLPVL